MPVKGEPAQPTLSTAYSRIVTSSEHSCKMPRHTSSGCSLRWLCCFRPKSCPVTVRSRPIWGWQLQTVHISYTSKPQLPGPGMPCPQPDTPKNPNSGFKLQLKGSVLQKAASDSFGQNLCLRLPLRHIYYSICAPNSHL